MDDQLQRLIDDGLIQIHEPSPEWKAEVSRLMEKADLSRLIPQERRSWWDRFRCWIGWHRIPVIHVLDAAPGYCECSGVCMRCQKNVVWTEEY